MFFVTLLLNQVITWMRQQPGTTSLRALLYMDEIFGFLPPVAEPPSKKPFLTLFKQARAYGLGVVLTTQNPVDLDYKALTNAGTWFIGRLQTERDKGRLLDGLEVAASGDGATRSDLEALISSLEKREFLLHNVHEGAPLTFRTRWAMSYLRGPLTRDQVSELMAGREAETGAEGAPAGDVGGASGPEGTPVGAGASGPGAASPGADAPGSDLAATPPAIAGDVEQVFAAVALGPTGAALALEEQVGPSVETRAQTLVYRPAALARGAVSFLHKRSGGQQRRELSLIARADASGGLRWDDAETLPPAAGPHPAPEEDARFAPLPESMNQERELAAARRDLEDYLYRSERITIFEAPELDEFSKPGESAADFRLRLAQGAREKRDDEIDRLEERYETKLDRIGERIRKARATLGRYEADASARKRETIVAIGESVLGAFLGRRSSRSASAGLRRMRMSASAKQRAEDAEENLESLQADAEELEAELAGKVDEIASRWETSALELEEVAVTPRRTDIEVREVSICWLPYRRVGYAVGGEKGERDLRAW